MQTKTIINLFAKSERCWYTHHQQRPRDFIIAALFYLIKNRIARLDRDPVLRRQMRDALTTYPDYTTTGKNARLCRTHESKVGTHKGQLLIKSIKTFLCVSRSKLFQNHFHSRVSFHLDRRIPTISGPETFHTDFHDMR